MGEEKKKISTHSAYINTRGPKYIFHRQMIITTLSVSSQ
ncbi:hypothetical protein, unlikely [Trypanosoma brucei brucei TREU927]|uniref:Uncharacterized protein n=1 Tax=Trypanosoma brucei brucei (strain 927/4 GUTat10.1) TaxID=185431 RepID=Q38EX2_TRYB2|nr:hypothetical protein, unlikely [Trypanosoma brucei brucei TREU927]EAN76648.1 hypothetical protein, unlikely [Trypanosoma brucei brucei TREU927]